MIILILYKTDRLYIKNRESLVKHLKEGTVDIALMEEFFIEDKEIKEQIGKNVRKIQEEQKEKKNLKIKPTSTSNPRDY